MVVEKGYLRFLGLNDANIKSIKMNWIESKLN